MNTMNTLLRWDPIRARWNPFKELRELETRAAAFFSPTAAMGDVGKEAMTVAEWSPLVDIVEDDKEYLIKAELPDMKKDEVKLAVENDVLTMSGERRYEQADKGRKHHRIERAYGTFVRSFSLPEDADGSKVTADYKDGVLHVHLPKSEKAKPRSIAITVT